MSGDGIDELQTIVERLNQPPFTLDLTLVALHRKSPLDLLQLVNDVFTHLDAENKRDLRDEEKAASSERMLQFVLGVLNYKPQDVQQFSIQFVQGNTDSIYPLLFWMLYDQLDALKKRAYLAKYLRNVDVPEEMFADQAVVSLYQEYKALQQEFKEIHRATDTQRQTKLDPIELEKEIEQLTAEREQLTTKLSKLQEKVDSPDFSHFDFSAILKSTHALRKEQEEAGKLAQMLYEEKQNQLRAEQQHVMARARFRRLQEANLVSQDPRRLLQQTREQMEEAQHKCNEKLEKEIRTKHKALVELNDALSSEPMMEDEVDQIDQEIRMLRQDVHELERKRDELLNDADGKMGFFRDRAAAVEKKRRQLEEQLEEHEEEKRDAQQDLQTLDESLNQLVVGGEKPKTDAQMKAYMKELQAKTELYKQKKTALQSVRDEVKILEHTENILRNRDDNINEFNEQLEREKGAEGYANTHDKLEDVSTKKNAVDQNKGDTLDEISRVVTSITKLLKTRKNKLAPQIKDLRTIRHKYEEVEKEYTKNKKIYDNCAIGLESERFGLEQEVEATVAGIQEEESSYFFLNTLSTISDARQTQTAQELAFQVGEEKLDQKFKTYREYYEKTISEQEQLAKKLRQDKISVGESHNDHIEQRSMFVNLRMIMDLKLSLQEEKKKQQHEEENAIMFSDGDMGGADRMVLE